MDLHERALSVLACRYANEVVIGAPAVITDDLIKTFNIAAVLRGTTVEGGDAPPSTSTRRSWPSGPWCCCPTAVR